MTVPTQVWLWMERGHSSVAYAPIYQSLTSFAQNLFWFALLVVVCFDARKRNFGRSISYFSGIAMGHILLIVFMFSGPIIADYSQRTHFDSEKWKLAVNERQPNRLRMVDELLKRYQLQGMSRQKIDELLGKPPQTNYFREYEYVYWLGPERGFISMDSEWLCLKFANNVATEVRICRD